MTNTLISKRVLVTGANGAIGRPVVLELKARGHAVVGLDLVKPAYVDQAHVGSVSDFELVKQAMAGVDAVVHLAAEPNDCEFVSRLVPANVIGPYNILQAAQEAGVKRVVLASSAQAASGVKAMRSRKVKVEDGSAPTNHYGLTKVWMEEMGRMYARVHKLSVVSVRIGWMVRNSHEAAIGRTAKHLPGMYISARDSGRLFASSVESAFPGPGEEITVYGTSRPHGDDGLDVTSAVQMLGYEPLDTYPEGMPDAGGPA
jgi:uronate dehydrogenase